MTIDKPDTTLNPVIRFNTRDSEIVQRFIEQWMPSDIGNLAILLSSPECEPIYLDCSPEELANSFSELTRVGFTDSIKRIFQGDHFYRSEAGKCPRCRRYRPEVYWNNENLRDIREAELCDRCLTNVFSVKISPAAPA